MDPNITYTSFRVFGSGFETQTYPIQSNLFVVPSMTASTRTLVNITIVAKPKQLPSSNSVTVVAPIGQEGTLGPKIVQKSVDISLTNFDKFAQVGYQVWQGSVDLGSPVTGAMNVKVESEGGVRDVLYLDGGVAGW